MVTHNLLHPLNKQTTKESIAAERTAALTHNLLHPSNKQASNQTIAAKTTTAYKQLTISAKQTQTSNETIAAKRTAAYRARKRMTPEGIEELKRRGRENSRRYRLKKKLEGQAKSIPKKKSTAMTSAQKSAAYRARKRMTQEGIAELRARGRLHSARHREKNKKKNQGTYNTHLKAGGGDSSAQPPDELINGECKSLLSEALFEFDMDEAIIF